MKRHILKSAFTAIPPSNSAHTDTSVALEGVDVDNTLGSLAKLSEVLRIVDAFKQHKEGECIDLFKPFVIGRQFLAADRNVLMSFATCWDLLSIFRSLAAGYLVQLQTDVTCKASLIISHVFHLTTM